MRTQPTKVRFYAGAREVPEEVFWQEVRLAAGLPAYGPAAGGEYVCRLTAKGVGAALRLLEARRRAAEASEASGAAGRG